MLVLGKPLAKASEESSVRQRSVGYGGTCTHACSNGLDKTKPRLVKVRRASSVVQHVVLTRTYLGILPVSFGKRLPRRILKKSTHQRARPRIAQDPLLI